MAAARDVALIAEAQYELETSDAQELANPHNDANTSDDTLATGQASDTSDAPTLCGWTATLHCGHRRSFAEAFGPQADSVTSYSTFNELTIELLWRSLCEGDAFKMPEAP